MLTPHQEQLKRDHGTPAEFRTAVFRAAADLFCTMEEAEASAVNYEKEWYLAGQNHGQHDPNHGTIIR